MDPVQKNLGDSHQTITVRRTTLEEILCLRERILIVGTDRTSPEFSGDRDGYTRHYAVYQLDQVIGCATLIRSAWQGKPAWQLRGMATDDRWQGRGVGSALLAFIEQDGGHDPTVDCFWCNARLQAIPFYEKHGWQVVSDAFMIEGVCMHKKMVKWFRNQPSTLRHPS